MNREKKRRETANRVCNLVIALILAIGLIACGQGSGQTSEVATASTWQEQYDLGIRYLSEGNYEEAIIAFTAAIEIDPNRAEAYVGRGDAYVGSGETEENLAAAQVDYELAIELDDSQAEFYQKLSYVYDAMGESLRAIEILEQGAHLLDDANLLEEAQRKQELLQENIPIGDPLAELEQEEEAEAPEIDQEVPQTAEPEYYTISFDANGGIVSQASKNVAVGSTYGSLPTPERERYLFDGWYTDAVGGVLIAEATTVSLTDNQTLYAHWLENSPSIAGSIYRADVSDVFYFDTNSLAYRQVVGEATAEFISDTEAVISCSAFPDAYCWYNDLNSFSVSFLRSDGQWILESSVTLGAESYNNTTTYLNYSSEEEYVRGSLNTGEYRYDLDARTVSWHIYCPESSGFDFSELIDCTLYVSLNASYG